MQSLEQENTLQFEEFNRIWDRKIEELNANIGQAEANLIASQQEELLKFEEEIGKAFNPKVKFSKLVLNMKCILEKMVKGKMYSEAQNLRAEIEKLEERENIEWERKIKESIQRKRDLIKIKHKNETDALKIRLSLVMQERLKQRKLETEKLYRFLIFI